MTYPEKPRFFDVGVFGETLYNIDVFGANIYLTHMLSSSIEYHAQIQMEYEEALVQNDEALQQEKEIELQVCESTFAMTSAMFDLWEKVYS